MTSLKQALFNRSYLGLKGQNFEQSFGSNYRAYGAAYRSAGGLCCAIGHLIEEAEYKGSMEGRTASYSEVYDAIIRSNKDLEFPEDGHEIEKLKELLDEMQGCHDSYNGESMKKGMKRIAEYYNIEFPDR